MPVSGALERYLVKPGAKVDLMKIDSDERALFQIGGKDDSAKAFDKLQDELEELQKVLYAQNKHRILLVLQAMDTGGKDGCVKHVFSRIDPQGIHVRSFKKPTEEELARDFLWRVHNKVPRNGEMVIFNRSHYEDVIAVKVKKLFPEKVWKQRYNHIVDFERAGARVTAAGGAFAAARCAGRAGHHGRCRRRAGVLAVVAAGGPA